MTRIREEMAERDTPPERLALQAALGELRAGVREEGGPNRGIPASRYSMGEAVPWCAAFVSWCYRQAGAALPGNPWLQRSVARLEAFCKAEGCWAPADAVIPRPGLVVFFANRAGSDTGLGRHCAIVERVSADGQTIHTVDGNWGDRVAQVERKVSEAKITGYAWAPTR